MNEDVYAIKLAIANSYLEQFGISWDDLPDINSLHDCENSSDIYDACNERLEDSGFPIEILE